MRHEFLDGLLSMKKEGCRIAAYGAAAKGNTLLNYAGVRRDLIEFIVDKNPAKQGKFMPGSRIPIVDESWLQATKPDVVVILPWNLEGEISRQLKAMNLEKTRILTSKDLLISDLKH
jgi:ABC-type hemin transport system substrate-binding protein